MFVIFIILKQSKRLIFDRVGNFTAQKQQTPLIGCGTYKAQSLYLSNDKKACKSH